MFIKILVGLVALLAIFLIYVSTRDGHFRYERSGVIHAPADKIFPYLSHFKLGGQWSPYEQIDPNLKRNFTGVDGQVGSAMDFDGNRQAGSGRLEMLKIVPNELVQIRLLMTKPLATDHVIEYRLTPEGSGTRFTWSMQGDGGFMGKLMGTLIDCEKMVAGQFEKGIQNLKTLVESQK